MTELDTDELRRELAPPWSDLREQRVLTGLRKRMEASGPKEAPPQRTSRRPVALSAALVAAGLAALWWVYPRVTIDPHRLRLSAAAVAMVDETANVVVLERDENLVVLAQQGGQVRYEVDPSRGETVVVRASGVEIRVLGTIFSVADDRWVEVSVERGRVLVDQGGERAILTSGERARFAPVERSLPELDREESLASPPGLEAEDGLRDPLPSQETSPTPSNRRARHHTPIEAPPVSASTLQKPEASPTEALPRIDAFQSLVDEAERLRMDGDLDGAADRYAQALRKQSNQEAHSFVLFSLGVVEEARHNFAAAARRFRAARNNEGTNFVEEALAAEARNWAKAERHEEALAASKLYRELYPNGAYLDALPF